MFGSGLPSRGGGFALSEHGDANVLTGASWECDRAADHLIGFAGIDAEAHDDVDGLVELLRAERLQNADGFGV